MAASGPVNRARMTKASLRTGCAGVLRISMLMNATERPENTNHTSIAPEPMVENLLLNSWMPYNEVVAGPDDEVILSRVL